MTRPIPLIMPWHGRTWLSMPHTRWLLVYGGLIVAVLIVAPTIDFVRYGTIRDARSTLIITTLLAVPVAIVLFVLMQRRDRPYRARQLALEGRCPACSHDLATESTSTDGNTTCPGCGSAWHLESSHTAQAALRSATEFVHDDRDRRHVMRRWVPSGPAELWRKPSVWWTDAKLCLFQVLFLVLALAFAISLVFFRFLDNWMAWPFFACSSAGMFFLVLRGEKFVGDRIDKIYLPKDHCRVCLEPLEGLEAEHDGCVVCPECSAAWRAVQQPRPSTSKKNR